MAYDLWQKCQRSHKIWTLSSLPWLFPYLQWCYYSTTVCNSCLRHISTIIERITVNSGFYEKQSYAITESHVAMADSQNLWDYLYFLVLTRPTTSISPFYQIWKVNDHKGVFPVAPWFTRGNYGLAGLFISFVCLVLSSTVTWQQFLPSGCKKGTCRTTQQAVLKNQFLYLPGVFPF